MHEGWSSGTLAQDGRKTKVSRESVVFDSRKLASLNLVPDHQNSQNNNATAEGGTEDGRGEQVLRLHVD